LTKARLWKILNFNFIGWKPGEPGGKPPGPGQIYNPSNADPGS